MITYNFLLSILLFLTPTILALPTSHTTDFDTNANTNTTGGFWHPHGVEHPPGFVGPRKEGPKTLCDNYGNVEDQTSAASPLTIDCFHIRANINEGGSWTWSQGKNPHTVVHKDTCMVGIELGAGVPLGTVLHIGNEDIKWMITTTLGLQFQKNENGDAVVGSKGTMDCPQAAWPYWKYSIKWGIWHTK